MPSVRNVELEIPIKHLLRIDEVALILRCSPDTVRRYARDGKLTRPRPGMIERASLKDFLGHFKL